MDTKSGMLSEEELKKRLTPEEYAVLRQGGTEAPFSGELLHADADGTFTCKVCGNKIFTSDSKFDSGTGWPSFDQAIEGSVELVNDDAQGMSRTEVRCANCGSHLGHVFDDGPTDTGKRYCINSVCLDLEEK
ncbi:peptide-methionine (R)-S-oxide reductase MsrB [Candidatus Kaiserbacteria bacterium]|nr:peptide-methionine (R)-S-oxide reductase MsrB [Candidatus Kaiserbacteria bacterium]